MSCRSTVRARSVSACPYTPMAVGAVPASRSIRPTATPGAYGERLHPDISGSKSRLWHVGSDGRLLDKIELDAFSPLCIARNPANGELWLTGHPSRIEQLSLPPLANGWSRRTHRGRQCRLRPLGNRRLEPRRKPRLMQARRPRPDHLIAPAGPAIGSKVESYDGVLRTASGP